MILKPMTLVVVLGLTALAGVAFGAATLSTAPGYSTSGATQCNFGDVGCEVNKALWNFIAPYVLPAIIVLVALFILPRFGRKGAALALIIVVGVVFWYIGIPGLMPPLRGAFGF